MTVEQRAKTKQALQRYGQKQPGRRWKDAPLWDAAIRQTLEYYDIHDPLRSALMRLRYFEHCTEEQTMGQLYIGRSTYQKAQLDLLSTVAVFAAQQGASF